MAQQTSDGGQAGEPARVIGIVFNLYTADAVAVRGTPVGTGYLDRVRVAGGMPGSMSIEETLAIIGGAGVDMAPIYAKWCELDIPIIMQVGQCLADGEGRLLPNVGRPISLDRVACDLPELKLIGIHIGHPWAKEMISVATEHRDVRHRRRRRPRVTPCWAVQAARRECKPPVRAHGVRRRTCRRR